MDSGVKHSGPFVLVGRTRSPEQRAQYEDIVKRGICPFCPEHLSEFHAAPILNRGKFWNISFADWPYDGVKHQFIVIANEHVEHIEDLSEGAGEELISFVRWAETLYGMKSAVLTMRFGDPFGNGGSVNHLHAQIFEADPERSDYKTPRLKMGPKEEEARARFL